MLKSLVLSMAITLTAGVAHAEIQGTIGMLSDDVAKAIMCEESNTIAEHMHRMGVLIRELTGTVQATFGSKSSDINKETVIQNAQMLRVHLATVFTLTPPKILAIDAEDPQGAKLIFQSYLLDMMRFTILLEQELLKSPVTPEEADQQQANIEGFINAIYNTVENAHSIFRD